MSEAAPEMRADWTARMDNAAETGTGVLDAKGKPASRILASYMEAMRAAGAEPLRDRDRE